MREVIMAAITKKSGAFGKNRKITWKEVKRQKFLLLWSAVFVIYGFIFCYLPLGGWIMALAEIVNIFPILARRIGFVKGMSAMVISIALGKTLGSLYHFFMRM